MPAIRLYTTAWCGLCLQAKALLDLRGLAYDEIPLDDDPAFRQTVFDLGGRWTVPLVVVGGDPVGGFRELAALDRAGILKALAERLAA
jgi:glutaredoxin 3